MILYDFTDVYELAFDVITQCGSIFGNLVRDLQSLEIDIVRTYPVEEDWD